MCRIAGVLLMSHDTRGIYPKGPNRSGIAPEITRPDLFLDPSSSVNNTFDPLTQLNVRCRPVSLGVWSRFTRASLQPNIP